MSNNIMLDRASELAIDVVNLCKKIKENKKEYVLTKQFLRCGTSVGANIHESKYAQSKADFISKLQIALKECYESEYWLELLYKTDYIEEDTLYEKLSSECGSVRRMLIASINTSKLKK